MLRDDATLTSDQIAGLVNDFLREALDDDEAERRTGPSRLNEDGREALGLALSTVVEESREALVTGRYPRRVREEADELLAKRGISLPRDSDGYRELCRGLCRAFIEYARIEDARLSGDYTLTPRDPLFLAPSFPQATRGKTKSGPMSAYVVRYVDEKGAAWGSKTKLEYEATFRLFYEIIGDRPVRSLERADIVRFKDTLLKLPPNFTKRYKGKTVQEILDAKPVGSRMAPKTINKYLHALAAFFNWAETNAHIEKSPARSLKIADPRRADEQRAAFSTEHLVRMVNAPLYTDCRSEHFRFDPGPEVIRDAKFWSGLLALFTGMRLNELLQLEAADITRKDGIDVIRVTAEGGHRLNGLPPV